MARCGHHTSHDRPLSTHFGRISVFAFGLPQDVKRAERTRLESGVSLAASARANKVLRLTSDNAALRVSGLPNEPNANQGELSGSSTMYVT